jgi:hypothetical protein
MEAWKERWDVPSWREFPAAGDTEPGRMAMRQCTHTGRPLGTEEFVHKLEEAAKRPLAPRKGGHPARLVKEERQGEILF